VERPASVVKELVENALDAGGSEVSVRAAEAGLSFIEVSDNGVGMDPDDALEALKRHATSKIRHIQDLNGLASLGFRGEALSSIGSVSRLELVTRWEGSGEGTRILAEAGKLLEASAWGAPQGTRVRVEDLFFNVPARRKFLRSEKTEAQHLRETVERIALVNPQVGFRYEYDGRRVLDCPAVETWGDRVRQIWGREVWGNLFPLYGDSQSSPVAGFLSHPNVHRPTTSGLWLYVNRRPVQDRGVLSGVLRGYGSLLEKGRYPLGVVQVVLDPMDVDVNVHPAKREVRFRDPRRVQNEVVGAIRTLLREQPWIPELGAERGEEPGTSKEEDRNGWISEEVPRLDFRGRPSTLPLSFSRPPEEWSKEDRGGFQWKRFMGQIGETYLVFSGRDGLVIVDQHAAHERIVYERLKTQVEEGGASGQGMLWNGVVELTAPESEILAELIPFLAHLGWTVEPFGGKAWRIRTVPSWMEPGDCEEVLREVVEACGEWGGGGEGILEPLLARMACHAAVKGKKAMGETEALALLDEMRRTPARGLCPHGRPALIEISLAELKRRFGRA
jgi:DNA mismatch repair protein MutL